MIAITVPLQAAGDDGTASPSPSGSATTPEGSGGGPAPGVVEDPGPVGEKGSGRDQLTPDEIERARTLALDDAFRAKSTDVLGKPGGEYLRTDLAEQAPGASGPRTADVYFYNYKDSSTVKRVVDLDSGKVVSTASAKDIQAPPSERETQEAVKLLLASGSGESRRLKNNYRDATDRSLTRPGQLDSTGRAYSAIGASGTAVVDKCATHRCISLFTRVGGAGPWIDMTDVVVDLSDRSVNRLKQQ